MASVGSFSFSFGECPYLCPLSFYFVTNLASFVSTVIFCFLSGRILFVFSTTLIESIYRAVPTISYQPGQNFTDSFLANKLGLSLPAYDFAGLKRALNTALDPKYSAQLRKRRDIMRRNSLFFSNGNAAQKVLDVVKRCQPS